jgi:hypothetical protein
MVSIYKIETIFKLSYNVNLSKIKKTFYTNYKKASNKYYCQAEKLIK